MGVATQHSEMIELKSKTSADFAFFFLKVKENKISLANPKERFLRSLPFFIRDARTSPNSCVKRDQDSNPPPPLPPPFCFQFLTRAWELGGATLVSSKVFAAF